MTLRSPTDEDRELIERLRKPCVERRERDDGYPYDVTIPPAEASLKAADRLESLLSDRAKLEEALETLVEAARSACDARLHTSLIEALAEADFLTLNRSTDRAT